MSGVGGGVLAFGTSVLETGSSTARGWYSPACLLMSVTPDSGITRRSFSFLDISSFNNSWERPFFLSRKRARFLLLLCPFHSVTCCKFVASMKRLHKLQ